MSQPYPFDFRNAGTTDEVVRMLREWLRKTADAFSDSWEAVSSTSARLTCNSILTRTFEEGVHAVPLGSIGFGIRIGDKPVPSLACMSTPDLVALIGSIVGSSFSIENRKLTTIEISLCEMVYKTLASALGAAWFGNEVLDVQVGDVEELPHFARLIPVKELVLCAQIELLLAETSVKLVWLTPRRGMEELLESTTGMSLKPIEKKPDEVVQTLPVELVGLLGQTDMTMGSVADLSPGDLLILDQKIDQPIPILIDKRQFCDGWPGRVKKRQAIEIAQLS